MNDNQKAEAFDKIMAAVIAGMSQTQSASVDVSQDDERPEPAWLIKDPLVRNKLAELGRNMDKLGPMQRRGLISETEKLERLVEGLARQLVVLHQYAAKVETRLSKLEKPDDLQDKVAQAKKISMAVGPLGWMTPGQLQMTAASEPQARIINISGKVKWAGDVTEADAAGTMGGRTGWALLTDELAAQLGIE